MESLFDIALQTLEKVCPYSWYMPPNPPSANTHNTQDLWKRPRPNQLSRDSLPGPIPSKTFFTRHLIRHIISPSPTLLSTPNLGVWSLPACVLIIWISSFVLILLLIFIFSIFKTFLSLALNIADLDLYFSNFAPNNYTYIIFLKFNTAPQL